MELIWQELTLGLDSARHLAQVLIRVIVAALLGGVRGATLSRAGLVAAAAPATLSAFDATFASTAVPYLSLWY